MTVSIRARALLAGAAALVMMSLPASAAPVLQALASGISLQGHLTPFVLKIQDRRWRRNRHGNRFRGRRRGFTHFYDGYYYAVPWWEDDYEYEDDYDDEPDYARGRGGSRHEDWCSRKYRSYKVRTNTWTDYDGNTRRCNSPFD